ncbi:SNF1-interacting protein [Modicella reniformis]|uniref:SNF1-interacting protein n=1 Tax=Modicella reniformis TaxID=1440133 RepID=A0A9P6IKR4_9FUNG|nr:SNF1-interacting protein [Modicella reniformis]
MGNASTKEKSDHIDGGALLPHGVYSSPQDYDFRIVQRLILQRKLAPFYKGLEDWDDNEDALEEKEKQLRTAVSSSSVGIGSSHKNHQNHGHTRSTSTQSVTRANHMTEAERDMRRLYQGAIECPICFLYYPRNINRTRCCDKPMCTECFVQLKRLESAPTESPACPYCVEPHFGVIYSSALVPSGLLSSPSLSSCQSAVGGTSMSVTSSNNSIERGSEAQPPSSPSARRRSTSHKSPEVVTADELRPDWNRRILAAAQRQTGSRRSSNPSPMSNTAFSLGRRLAAGRQGTSSRRSNSSTAAADYNGYLTAMREMGTDLEELMIMEAMRLSLQDEQERQAREAAATTAAAPNVDANPITQSGSILQHGESSRSGTGRGSATSRSPLSSPIVPPSTSSSSSITARSYAGGSRPRGDEDTSSLATTSDGEQESEPDSDENGPELLHSEALRFARTHMPARTPVTRKHRAQGGRTNAEAV